MYVWGVPILEEVGNCLRHVMFSDDILNLQFEGSHVAVLQQMGIVLELKQKVCRG